MNRLFTRRSSSSRYVRKPRNAVILLLFTVMLLAPVMGQVATARQADAIQRLAETDEEATEEPTEELILEATEEPVEEATEVPTEEPQNELLGAIEISYWECPGTVDPNNPDLENLGQNCDDKDGVPFAVADAMGGNHQQQTGEFGDGHVSFTELPTGQTSVSGPGGSGVAWCNGIVQHGGPETGYQQYNLSGGSIAWDLQDDEIVFCDWIILDDVEPADLLVHKFSCPAEYDVHDSASDPMMDCTTPVNGVTFKLTDSDPSTVDLQTDTGDSIQGAVMFGGTPGGNYTLEETLPDNTASAFLWSCTVEGESAPDPSMLPLNEGTSWSLTMAGKDTECYWFNVLDQDMATEVPTGTATEPVGEVIGHVEIEYRECASGYTFLDGTNEDDLDQMFMDCAQVDGVEFTIDQGGPDGATQLTGEFGESHVSFSEVPIGMRTITQTQSFPTTYVVCMGIVSNGGPETGAMVMPVTNGAIQWNLIDEEIAYCSWFVSSDMGTEVPGTETPTETATEPTGEEIGHVEIEYRECATGYTFLDGTNEDELDQMFTDCAQVDGVEFTIDQGGPDGTSQLTGEFGESHVSFSEVPIGMRTITQTQSFPTTYVVCMGIVSNGGPETGAMVMPVTNGAIQWNLIDEEIAYCNWFVSSDMQSDPLNELVGHVNINYWECPAATDYATITDDGLAADCTSSSNGVVFTVTSGAYSETQATGDINDGVIAFAEVPTGTISVKQVTPPQQLIVICQGIVSNGGPETAISRLPITQATIQWNLLDDEIVYCDWYVIPVAVGFGEVAINKHACPATFDTSTASIYDLAANCHEDPGTVPFTVVSGAFNQTTNATGGGNYASFADVPSGSVTVTETVPDGYVEPIVYCKVESLPGLDDVVPTHRVMLTSDASFTRSLGDSQLLWCDVYNVIDPGYVVVAINKHACPTGFDAYNATIYELAANCHEDPGTVPFTVSSGDYTETKSASGGGNYASFPEVPAGTLTISEALPDGYDLPIIYCKVELALDLTDVEATTLYPVDDNVSFTKDVLGGHLLWCDVFNVPDDGSTITITKYNCPEGTAYEEEDFWYQENCTEAAADVQFKLTHSEGSSNDLTDGGGMVQWTDVPLGDFSLQEYIPEGYGDPVVICGFTAMTNGAIVDGFPQRVEAPGGYFASSLELAGTDYFCFWYNIPAGPGDLIIYKYTCPIGYDASAWNAKPEESCTEGTNGITFMADGPDGYSSQTDTGDSIQYAVNFGSLEPGSYTVTEVIPDGIEYAFVWNCYGQRMGELRPTPLSMGDTLNIDVGAGEEIVCYWYNVPEDPDGALTVIKFECNTVTFVSEVDCEVYEGGQTFDLAQWNGGDWNVIDTRTTDAFGRYSWYGLDEGQYWLEEKGREWCQMTSENLSDDGNWLEVYDGQETVVKVYNCTGQPGKPGKTPTKYPNTGAPLAIREEWRLAA